MWQHRLVTVWSRSLIRLCLICAIENLLSEQRKGVVQASATAKQGTTSDVIVDVSRLYVFACTDLMCCLTNPSDLVLVFDADIHALLGWHQV